MRSITSGVAQTRRSFASEAIASSEKHGMLQIAMACNDVLWIALFQKWILL
jgi:hypothetical protein